MSDIFLSEKDGGAFKPTVQLDLSTDDGLQSVAYCLLFSGNTPLHTVQGRDKMEETFEESMDAKITISQMEHQETLGTTQLKPMITQGLVKAATIKIKNTALERLEIYVNFELLDGSPVSEKIAVFENGVITV